MGRLVLVDADALERLNVCAYAADAVIGDMPIDPEEVAGVPFYGWVAPVVPELPEGTRWLVDAPDHVEAVFSEACISIIDGALLVEDHVGNPVAAPATDCLAVIARWQSLQGGAK